MKESERFGIETTTARGLTLTQAARMARGADPLQLLASGDTVFVPEVQAYDPPVYAPELHILDSEWYFTSETSASLSAMVAGRRSCLLGTPTVALHMPIGDRLLVDRSPYLLDRFPSLLASEVRNVDVHGWATEPGYDAVVLDPPWYLPELGQWLDIALATVELDGVVLLPLLGEQTRPTARVDRDRVLKFLSSVGQVDVLRNVVEYEIPLFESRALSAAGVSLSGPWRRADLAITRVSSRPKDAFGPLPSDSVSRPSESAWSAFLIGSQVVKLRSSPTSRLANESLLRPIRGVDGFTLDSISRRDPRIQHVDVWSSRNRVARVSDVERLTLALHVAANSSVPMAHLTGELRTRGFNQAHVEELFDYLEVGSCD